VRLSHVGTVTNYELTMQVSCLKSKPDMVAVVHRNLAHLRSLDITAVLYEKTELSAKLLDYLL